MTRDENSPLLDLQQAADKLGVSRWTVRRWIDSGYLHGERVSMRKTRVALAEVQRVLEGRGER